ncbi:hypothetical protein ACQPZG_11570 [Streptomyces sp. CA-294286]|uniref:hypothetical protein n=1 Tax=Streptomyces sp. CA-294286 TaxID=3240070 RepID=UPI003D921630
MRNLVARACRLVLRILLPAQGCHRRTVRPACVPAAEPLPVPVPARRRPSPAHEELHRFVEQQIQRAIEQRRLQHERRFALSEAVAGRDHPYSYPDAPFPYDAFVP